MWLDLGVVFKLLAIILFCKLEAFSLVFCWYFWYLCCFLEKLQILLFALWFSLQFAHFRIEWGHSLPLILQILQLWRYVVCFSAQIWHVAEALQILVECPHFWQFWHWVFSVEFSYFCVFSHKPAIHNLLYNAKIAYFMFFTVIIIKTCILYYLFFLEISQDDFFINFSWELKILIFF